MEGQQTKGEDSGTKCHKARTPITLSDPDFFFKGDPGGACKTPLPFLGCLHDFRYFFSYISKNSLRQDDLPNFMHSTQKLKTQWPF